MRKFYLIISFFFLMSLLSSEVKCLDISLTSASFHSQNQVYLEVYIYVVGSSATFDTLENGN